MGAICFDCGKDMTKTPGCTFNAIQFNGLAVRRVKWNGAGRCPDCDARPGNNHHFGCDMERCPSCHMQLISCDCLGEKVILEVV